VGLRVLEAHSAEQCLWYRSSNPLPFFHDRALKHKSQMRELQRVQFQRFIEANRR